jgi:hypothetical protein
METVQKEKYFPLSGIDLRFPSLVICSPVAVLTQPIFSLSLSLSLSLSMALQPFGPWPIFQFLNPVHSRTIWKGEQLVTRPLPIHRTQNKRTQTSMPRMGFEPKIPVCELAKSVHALDRVATVIGSESIQFI